MISPELHYYVNTKNDPWKNGIFLSLPTQKQILIQIRSRKRNTCLSDPVNKEDKIAELGAKHAHAIPLLQLVQIRSVVLVYGTPVLQRGVQTA